MSNEGQTEGLNENSTTKFDQINLHYNKAATAVLCWEPAGGKVVVTLI
jgi:hypothetical protein